MVSCQWHRVPFLPGTRPEMVRLFGQALGHTLKKIPASELVGTKGVDGFYQEATIKEQAHKLSPALRASGIKQECLVWQGGFNRRHNLE